MQDSRFIVREPLLNTQERVLGYELSWQDAAGTGRAHGVREALHLMQCVTERLGSDGNALLGDQLVFLDLPAELLAGDALELLPVRGTVLALRADELIGDAMVTAVGAARAKGFAISLRHARRGEVDPRVLRAASYLELHFGEPDFASQVQLYRGANLPGLRLIARGVTDWKACELCASLGMFAFVGRLHLMPRPGNHARELNPAQAMILQLMDMVRKNADVRHLEGVLKRDAALSYKLLRYINSAGFGLGCEIQSLRHAVTMLGYSPLYRWLALLLATSTTTGYSPVLMQNAVIRGRFAELLGATFLPRSEVENLFVAGMFSLLDRLLGVPMDQVLEKLQLSESVTQALLSRDGIYGPFLALAEACELNDADLEDKAVALCISPRQVNDAHLAALSWAQLLQL